MSNAGGLNFPNYQDATFDALVLAASEASQVDSGKMYQLAEASLMSDDPVLALFSYSTRRLVNPKLRDWVDNPMDVHLSRWLYWSEERSD